LRVSDDNSCREWDKRTVPLSHVAEKKDKTRDGPLPAGIAGERPSSCVLWDRGTVLLSHFMTRLN